jgi:hypothetical protein
MSRKYVLDNIRANLQKMAAQVPERLQTFTSESGQELTLGNFVQYHDYEPERLLVSDSWTGWKARTQLAPVPSDPDLGPPPCMRIIPSAGSCCTGNPAPTLPWTHPQDRTRCITPPGDAYHPGVCLGPEKFCCNLIPKWLNVGRLHIIETMVEFPWNLAWLQDGEI